MSMSDRYRWIRRIPMPVLGGLLIGAGLIIWVQSLFSRRSVCPACKGSGDAGGNVIGCPYCGGDR